MSCKLWYDAPRIEKRSIPSPEFTESLLVYVLALRICPMCMKIGLTQHDSWRIYSLRSWSPKFLICWATRNEDHARNAAKQKTCHGYPPTCTRIQKTCFMRRGHVVTRASGDQQTCDRRCQPTFGFRKRWHRRRTTYVQIRRRKFSNDRTCSRIFCSNERKTGNRISLCNKTCL